MSQFSVIAVTYDIDGQTYEGKLVFDSTVSAPRPGLIMSPNWMGVSDGAVELAKEAAGSKYVVLISDIYGQSVRPTNGDEAAAAMMPLKNDRPLLRKRMTAGLEALQAQTHAPLVQGQLAAFGFCFGGCAVLELARAGAPLKAVVSFHGTLDTPEPKDNQHIQGSVLVLHGAADPLVPAEQLPEFEKALEATAQTGRIDWQIVKYGGAMHSFTDKAANNPPMQQYNHTVACRAFKAMANLLDEVF